MPSPSRLAPGRAKAFVPARPVVALTFFQDFPCLTHSVTTTWFEEYAEEIANTTCFADPVEYFSLPWFAAEHGLKVAACAATGARAVSAAPPARAIDARTAVRCFFTVKSPSVFATDSLRIDKQPI
ncbi:hypothetical protein GCM10029978_114250 [Actinoallomurus acanthiterrae]